jgi:hypothetical protein
MGVERRESVAVVQDDVEAVVAADGTAGEDDCTGCRREDGLPCVGQIS